MLSSLNTEFFANFFVPAHFELGLLKPHGVIPRVHHVQQLLALKGMQIPAGWLFTMEFVGNAVVAEVLHAVIHKKAFELNKICKI